ncbi:PHD finger-like domain-containing protein 5A isoform 1-T1 [Cyanocitta cristata]
MRMEESPRPISRRGASGRRARVWARYRPLGARARPLGPTGEGGGRRSGARRPLLSPSLPLSIPLSLSPSFPFIFLLFCRPAVRYGSSSIWEHLFGSIGRLCEKCDGKCVICDSYVRPCTLVRICDECNYGSYQGRCVICGGPGVSDAYYCKECTIQEKDRDGCPKIVNLGSSKTDLFYERKKYGFKKR